jgi:hypothetical protein
MLKNKSLWTNVVAAAVVVSGIVFKLEILQMTGMFALSGAITNWLAIYMLFEKVPGLYGSGVIPSRFEDFKCGIKSMIMGQFFTAENIEKFFASATGNGNHSALVQKVNGAIDYDLIFDRLVEAIMASSFGSMLGMFGGEGALKPLRDPFKEKMEVTVVEILESNKFKTAFAGGNADSTGLSDSIVSKVEGIVDARLDELTPQMVKEIIQEMIRKHLGWLVVWGGVFGGLIGLITALMSKSL